MENKEIKYDWWKPLEKEPYYIRIKSTGELGICDWIGYRGVLCMRIFDLFTPSCVWLPVSACEHATFEDVRELCRKRRRYNYFYIRERKVCLR